MIIQRLNRILDKTDTMNLQLEELILFFFGPKPSEEESKDKDDKKEKTMGFEREVDVILRLIEISIERQFKTFDSILKFYKSD